MQHEVGTIRGNQMLLLAACSCWAGMGSESWLVDKAGFCNLLFKSRTDPHLEYT